MYDQEFEYHVHKLEVFFNAASLSKQERMKPGIRSMIRKLRSDNMRLPLSLKRMERQLEQDVEADLFDNVPV